MIECQGALMTKRYKLDSKHIYYFVLTEDQMFYSFFMSTDLDKLLEKAKPSLRYVNSKDFYYQSLFVGIRTFTES